MRYRIETKHDESPFTDRGEGEITVYLDKLTFGEQCQIREAIDDILGEVIGQLKEDRCV